MKYWKIPYQEYPTWVIDLSKLDNFTEICAICKNLGIEASVYTFIFRDEVIKHGLSADNSSTYGERIYRQAGHLAGWKTRLTGSSGSDILSIDQLYFAKNKINLNRNEMVVIIRDLTNVPNPCVSDPKWLLKKHERDLIKLHEDEHGSPPIGNIKSEDYLDNKPFISSDTFTNLFSDCQKLLQNVS
jgi:hypothetical protein